MFLSKYSLERNYTIASLFRTQFTPDFLIAEYHGLRNIIFCVTKDLASGFDLFGTGFLRLLFKENVKLLHFLCRNYQIATGNNFDDF
jgi:hypothetical protein